MNTKMKTILCAALAAGLMVLPRAHASTSGVMPATPPAAPAAAPTNNDLAQVNAQLFGDPVIVKGKGFEIKQSDLDAVVDALKARVAAAGQTVPTDELTRNALDSLIANRLLLQQATAADKAQGKKDAERYINAKIKQFGSQDAVEMQLKAAGKTLDQWRAETTRQTTATAVLVRKLNAAPTDAEIQKYYEDNPSASEVPEEAHIRHILMLTIDPKTQAPLPDAQIQAKKKQMQDILKRARAGADFAALAQKYSEDPNTKDNGGELPPLARDQMKPELATAVFALTNDQVSDVIQMPYGFELVKLIDKTPARKLALTDKLPGANTDITLEDYLKEQLTAKKLQELAPAYIEKLCQSPDVQIVDPTLKALMAQTNPPADLPETAPAASKP